MSRRSLKMNWRGSGGTSTIEYAFVVACIAVAATSSVSALSRSSNRTFNVLTNQLGGGTDTSTPGGHLSRCPIGSVWVYNDARSNFGRCVPALSDDAGDIAPEVVDGNAPNPMLRR